MGLVLAVLLGVALFVVAAAPSTSAAPASQVLAWGHNAEGELGNGGNTDSNVPVSVSLPAGTTITALAGGRFHSLGLTSTGQVLAWGANAEGDLGNGSNTESNVPVSVSLPAGTTVAAIATGGFHGLALTSTGQVLAWGHNSFGELGNGSNTRSNVPVSVSLPAGTTVAAIAAGVGHSLALTSTGQVLAWGHNSFGELGDGGNTDSNVPVSVSLPTGTTITALTAGRFHSLGLTSTGQVLAWGHNAEGDLGDGGNTDSNVPVSVSLPARTTVTAIAAWAFHSLALTSTGRVLAWGANRDGELGDGGNADSNVPVSVSLPIGTTATAIAAGVGHSLALTSTGQVLAWGHNSFGELGDGGNTDSNVPVSVSLPAGTAVTAIAAGGSHSLAVSAHPSSRREGGPR